jgi:hypothetical protein
VIVIGIEPARIAWGLELSPEVRDAIPAVVSAVLADVSSGAGERSALAIT